MLVNLQTVLAASKAAVGSFNVLDLDMAQAVLQAAEQCDQPVIIGIASRHFRAVRAEVLVPSLVRAIEQSKVPVALHLDHASPKQVDMIRQALDLGFSSIMIDGSALGFEDNVAVTRSVVEFARTYNAGVEAELGGIAGEEGVADTYSDSPEALPYTDAVQARIFVAQTSVDALAIAVGTAHGIYTAAPQLNFDTIEACANAVSVPLVMHGATGVKDADMQRAVHCGIGKINYFSGLLKDAMDTVRYNAGNFGNDYLAFKAQVQQAWVTTVSKQIELYALSSLKQSENKSVGEPSL